MAWLLVGLGGAIGSIARHGLNHLVHQRALTSTFPWGVFLINVSGSVVIGAVAGLLASNRIALTYPARTFVIVGVLGGYTTFSSFSLDTFALLRDGHPGQAMLNAVGQVALGLLGTYLGYRLTT